MPDHEIINLASSRNIVVDYSDDDVIIIDNIRKLAEPSPTRVKMNMLAVATRGKVQVNMNAVRVEIRANQLLLCPPNITFSDFMFSPDYEFKAVFLTSSILQSFLREKISIWNDLMYIHKQHVLTMCEQDIEFFSHFYDMIRLCIDANPPSPYRGEVIQSIIRGALLGLCGTLQNLLPADAEPAATQPDNFFQRFLHVLGTSPVKHRPVEYYADLLCITPKYLSVICKKHSDKTANEWITEFVMEDIRYQLLTTDHSVKQICGQLGFPNPSFFGRYVKEHFGMTPKQLRNATRTVVNG